MPCCGAPAAERVIRGAFGFELGKAFDTTRAIGSMDLGDSVMYQVTPDPPFAGFKDYYVTTTPQEQAIYRIQAMAWLPDMAACEREFARVLKTLKQTWGESDSEADFAIAIIYYFMDMELFTRGKRHVALHCSQDEEEGKVMLYLAYEDEMLIERVEED